MVKTPGQDVRSIKWRLLKLRCRLGLTFEDKELETSYQAQLATENAPRGKGAISFILSIWLVASAIDPLMLYEYSWAQGFIRLSVFLGLLLIAGVIWSEQYIDALNIINTAAVVIIACGSILYYFVTSNKDITHFYGFILIVIFGVFVYVPIRFEIALTVSIVSSTSYMIFVGQFTNIDANVKLVQVLAVSSVLLIGGFTGFSLERSRRQGFDRDHLLQLAKDEADRASAAKSNFLTLMSHELRTPINGILGVARLTQIQGSLSPRLRGQFQAIEKSGEHLRKLIDDVLDITRIESGNLQFSRQLFYLDGLIDEITQIVKPLADEQGDEINVIFEQELPTAIVGDEARFRQILLNIIGNAIKFTKNGNITIMVAIEHVSESRCKIGFTVRDTGIGIPENQLHTIFDPLVQASNASNGRFGGTGLGLSIARKLASAMGGEIYVTSKLGEGSTFTVHVEAETAPIRRHQETHQEPLEPLRKSRQLAILLVEDNDVNQAVAQGLLEVEGHRVTVVATGSDALDVIRRRRFDAILMDIRLPDMSGMCVAEKIRKLETGLKESTPIIALTANIMPEDTKAYLSAGMLAVVAKPITPRKLYEALHLAEGQLSALASMQEENIALVERAFDNVELSKLLSHFSGAEIVVLLGKLDGSVAECLQQIENAYLNDKHLILEYQAHRLAGAAINFALKQLHSCSIQLQQAAGKQDRQAVQSTIEELCDVADISRKAIAALRRRFQ